MDVRHLTFLARQPSARLQDRERFWGLPKRGIALILANALFWQPIWAQADGIAVSGGTNTTLSQAGNGVPVVNIAAPNASGLSHNQYQQYNVGSQGLILNNATGRTQSTQLGGIIVGNPNLHGRAAGTILNEVVGANASQLNGYTEVAGQGARVIVANPYGVSCNGCGFINTPRVTITTGKPVLGGNGQVDHFQVDGGTVSIQGQGLDASQVEQFDIITRAAQINAQINAKQLAIVAGRNNVDAQTNTATALADDGSAKPSLAIDSSALGGMYAGAIKLVGTEAGVGVRLAGNLAASGGDIQIDANGQLNVGQVAASGAVKVNAGNAELQGKVYAASVDVHTTNALNVEQSVAARDRISLASDGQLTNGAVIEAGVNADNSRNAAGDVNMSAQHLRNAGSVVASRGVQATVGGTLDNQGGTLNGQANTQVMAGTLNNQNGRVLGQDSLGVTAGQATNRQGLIASGGSLTVNASELDNRNGELSSQGNLNTTITGTFDNSAGGRLAGAGVTVTTGTLNNQNANLTSSGTLRLNAGQVDNSAAGRIASAQGLTASVSGLDQHGGGQLFSNTDVTLDLNHGQLNNQGGLIDAPGQLVLRNLAGVNNQHGEISSKQAFTLAASTLNNTDGALLSDQRLTVQVVGELNNTDGGVSGNGLDLRAGTLLNDNGSVNSDADLALGVDGALSNQNGEVLATGNATVNAGSLDNRQAGVLASGGDLTASVSGALNNQGGRVSSSGALVLHAGSVDNGAGRILSQHDLQLTTGNLSQQAGKVVAQGNLTVTAASLDNRAGGLVGATKALTLNVGDLDNRAGELSSRMGVTVSGQQLNNSDSGKVIAANALQLTVDRLINRAQGVLSGNTLSLTGASLDNSGGVLASQQGMNLGLSGALLNSAGRISSEAALALAVGRLDNSNGSLSSGGPLTLNSAGAVNNQHGALSTDSGLVLTSASLDNRNHGNLSGKANASVSTGAFDNSQGGQLTSTGTLTLNAGQVTNQAQGRIAATQAVTASVASLDQQGGELFSQGELTLDLNHGQLNNQNGLIHAPGALLLRNLVGVNNQHGEISSELGFDVYATSLDNSDGKVLSDHALNLRVAQALANVRGVISAAALGVNAGSVDNSTGLLSSRGAFTLGADGHLLNAQGQVIADGALLLNAASADNSDGQIASKQQLTATIGNLQQHGGSLISLGALSLSGAQLDNSYTGLISALGALALNVSTIDNRGGEVSGQGDLSFTGHQLDNSDSGRVTAQGNLGLTVDQLTNHTQGVLSGKAGVALTGTQLDNSGGRLLSDHAIDLGLSGALLNDGGAVNSEGTLAVRAGSLSNHGGNLSSGGALTVNTTGALDNQGGKVMTDGALGLHSASLNNAQSGTISGKGTVTVRTGAFDNSHNGQLNSADSLQLTATQVTNQAGGNIGAQNSLVASVTDLNQQGGTLFSNGSLTLDLNHGQLDNQHGLINAPGTLLLKQLAGVNNQHGEISSGQAFDVIAQSFDNGSGKLLSNQALIVRVAQALNNVQGMIAAASLTANAGSLDNSSGTLIGRGQLGLTVDGAVVNRDSGLINSQGTLDLAAATLDSSNGGEVSTGGDLGVTVGSLVQNGGRLVGDSAVRLDLQGGDLSNRNGLVKAQGQLTVNGLRDLANQAGEISSLQGFALSGRNLDNSNGRLISNRQLALNAAQLVNQNGLISGWQGLNVNAASLDNRNNGTLSSRDGDLGVNLTGALLNGNAGALVSQRTLTLTAASVDNQGGILSSASRQTLTVGGLLNNSGNGLIDSGAALGLSATTLNNSNGAINAQQALNVTATDLNNAAGSLAGNAAVTLDLLGTLDNTAGKLASAGNLSIQRASQINNQHGQLISQGALTLASGGLDNSNGGTVAANDALAVTATGAVQNANDGLIYSKNASLTLQAASLANAQGKLQSEGVLGVSLSGDLGNQNGKLIAQSGALNLAANTLDNRGGVLASLRSAFTARVDGVLKNGYALDHQGGVIQAQSLDLRALAGIDNYGGRIAAQAGDTLVNTGNGNFDNRNGGLYASGRVSVAGSNFDNSGDNDGQIAGQQVDMTLAGALNNRLGIIESASTLNITAASLDNQTGKLRALGTSGTTALNISGLLDNRNGTLETANADLALNAGNLLNTGGSVLHVGNGNFGLATANVMNAGGSLVTRGGMTLNADSWTNSSVIQAGRLAINVGSFTQTAAGQLLASTALVGTGGNWVNDGVLASDGTMSLNLSGGYSGNGRVSSLGTLGLTANQLNVGSAGSITGGARTDINVGGQLNNLGRITSAADMFVNADGITNGGTLGAAQNATFTTPTLVNQGLLFSGGNMASNAGTFTNQQGDLYSVGSVTMGGYGTAQANQVSNISGSMESGGRFAINAANFENRTQGSTAGDNFAVGRTLVSGFIAVQCLDCSGDHYSVNYIARETFEGGQDNDTSAAALLTAGGDFAFNGGSFLNSKSTIAASGNITIQATNVKNLGAVSGSVERTRTYTQQGVTDGTVNRFMPTVVEYNQRNNPDFPYVYYKAPSGELRLGVVYYKNGREPGHDGGLIKIVAVKDLETSAPVADTLSGYAFHSDPQSQYDPASLMQLPSALTSLTLVSDVEVAKDGTSNAGRSAVIQAGGNVSITATQDLQNSVIHEDYAVSAGTNKVASTQANGTNRSVVVHLNAQLPPDLAQQQINPLSLPGFSLPTGQNGLFRLSGQGGNSTAAPASAGAQNWVLGGASLATGQRDQAVVVDPLRDLHLDSGNAVAGSTRQVEAITRAVTGVDTTTAALDTAPSGNTSPRPATASDVPSLNAGSAGTAATLAATQTVARVQGLPNTAAKANANKYLIETNPVLTDLKQFMSSDYLLGNLGYDPDASWKRLGDGLYEQRLVQQAITARTGQAFIDGQTSNEAQFKYLMNNAIASKSALNLSVGVGLTSEQVAALTHDIVWMESQEVNGEQVLVPVVYLAQASGRLGPTGALIAGNDVSLIAGKDLDNVGTLKATNNLSATAAGDLVNSGLMQAGNRLDALAGNTIVNKAGGIIAGRDVSVSAITGDVTNERSKVSLDSDAQGQLHKDYADNAARIEAANDLTISAGRDISNSGSVLQSGRDMSLKAGRDVDVTSSQVTNSLYLDAKHNSSDITQTSSTVTAGRDLSIQAGRDINLIASQLDAKRDMAMTATENLVISSAADEEHSLSKSKKVKRQEDHVSQVETSITSGGSVALSAGQDMTVTSSNITAANEAYLVAGGNLDLLAAQDSDYSLYDMKKKGHFGSKKTKRDEVTQVTNIGTEIKTGGDLLLASGGDQTYQVATLDSGKDLTLNSGGAINFESVKDLHQESHEKSNSSLAWNSMSGKGKTDETLRQSELVAKGAVAINAVDGLHIDVKQVNQQTVSQAIDAMVKADPQLAWLKDAEKRGDVDWRQVEEIHQSFKYSNSGLGVGAQLALAILMAVVVGPAAMSALATATGGTIVAAGGAAVATAAATNAASSFISNRGNLGAVFKDTTSSDALKGYAIAGVTAGIIDYADTTWFTGADGAANGGSKVVTSGAAQNPGYASSMLTPESWGQTLLRSGAHAVITSSVSTAINGGSFSSNLSGALVGEAIDLGAAIGNKSIGDIADKLHLAPGTAGTIFMHAMLGGVISMASGGDFKSGAIAGGAADGLTPIANQYMAQYVSEKFAAGDLSLAGSQYKITTAQIIGLISAGLAGGNVATGSMIGGNGEKYNQQGHFHDEDPEEALRHEIRREEGLPAVSESEAFRDGKPYVEPIVPGLPLIGLGGGKASGAPLVSKGSDVTPSIIQQALKGDASMSAQGAVSLPAVQRYVDRLLNGDVAPAIKMDGNVIIDGNHRYIAAKILGRVPDVTIGVLSPSKVGQTKPVSSLNVDEFDWGNK
ncbi:filamentous hemagglutinin N-terminal domain-containing protein [Pseudomonas sp. RIT-PI-S]|uniref:two-partner secretion domain-containing protein n=1 Tax=Pseudomonas sp. RIT-PI-S TaxID=3035295 RepID=UPI0021D9F67C|nr:filamentous hemagglutinin N-terminal domain-containing protein [Pseudomonas sp. RIT-PI-S]